MVVSLGLLPSLLVDWGWLEATFFPSGVLPKHISIPKRTQMNKTGK